MGIRWGLCDCVLWWSLRCSDLGALRWTDLRRVSHFLGGCRLDGRRVCCDSVGRLVGGSKRIETRQSLGVLGRQGPYRRRLGGFGVVGAIGVVRPDRPDWFRLAWCRSAWPHLVDLYLRTSCWGWPGSMRWPGPMRWQKVCDRRLRAKLGVALESARVGWT